MSNKLSLLKTVYHSLRKYGVFNILFFVFVINFQIGAGILVALLENTIDFPIFSSLYSEINRKLFWWSPMLVLVFILIKKKGRGWKKWTISLIISYVLSFFIGVFLIAGMIYFEYRNNFHPANFPQIGQSELFSQKIAGTKELDYWEDFEESSPKGSIIIHGRRIKDVKRIFIKLAGQEEKEILSKISLANGSWNKVMWFDNDQFVILCFDQGVSGVWEQIFEETCFLYNTETNGISVVNNVDRLLQQNNLKD